MKLVLIAANPALCAQAEKAGVGRIMVDLERMGKFQRQRFRDTWISKHRMEDIAPVAQVLCDAELMVRVNPFFEGSEQEIEEAIREGAQLIMLPMFREMAEIEEAARIIDARARFVPLIETAEAFLLAQEVVSYSGVDEVFVGLNDLQLSLDLDFMFEPLSNGMLDRACTGFAASGKPYGFGGIARIGEGDLAAELILREHARLGSTRVNLSRTFAGRDLSEALGQSDDTMQSEIRLLLEVYDQALKAWPHEMATNRRKVAREIERIVSSKAEVDG